MTPINVVCLCKHYDMKAFFETDLKSCAPWVRLKLPNEIEDPTTIRHALAFWPGPEDFTPYENLELVSSAGAGVDALLNNPSLNPDVAVSRVIAKEQGQMIAAFAIWHIVNWQRRMLRYPEFQKTAEWNVINRTPPSKFPVGVLGYGKIGGQLAAVLRALGYPVTAWATRSRAEDDGTVVVAGDDGLAQIARRSMAVVNVLPLTGATEGILNADFFGKMRDEAIVINLGRGAHLGDADLIAALDKGRPAMAALDAFSVEPLPSDHPFWRQSRILITPHVAGDADTAEVAAFIAEGIKRFEAGQSPEGLVNRSTGY